MKPGHMLRNWCCRRSDSDDDPITLVLTNDAENELRVFNKRTLALLPNLEEILDEYYIKNSPKPVDYECRRDLVRVFNAIARELYGSYENPPVIEVFGSFMMDMFSAQSDLDLSLNFSNIKDEVPRDKKIQTLRLFAKKFYSLQRRGHVCKVQVIAGARVPIVKLTDIGTGIECDLSIENRDGISRSQIIYTVSAIDERFRKLCFLMKAWAKAHGINSSRDRTLNSLSIVSLVIFHLQNRDPPILPPFSELFKGGIDPSNVRKSVEHHLNYGKGNRESLAKLFATLFIRLASVEKLWRKGLCASLYKGTWISWNSQIGCINIEDFINRSENVARCVGEDGVKKIYKRIHSSADSLATFTNGRMKKPKLKVLLFGVENVEKKLALGDARGMGCAGRESSRAKVFGWEEPFCRNKMKMDGEERVVGWKRKRQPVDTWEEKQEHGHKGWTVKLSSGARGWAQDLQHSFKHFRNSHSSWS